MNRRDFLGLSAAALGAAQPINARGSASTAVSRIVVGVMGTGGRGTHLATQFQRQPDTTVAYVCDVDRAHAEGAADAVEKAAPGARPRAVNDFQEILRDKSVDVLVVATPNHWHAPAAILGCRAGKHVYVEKPCCHNAQEGEWLVAAARKHRRHVQMGNQRRSWPVNQEAIEMVRGGAIGRVYHAQAWYTADRGTIGHGQAAPVPAGLDYELWQGPAPRTPYRTNILPYNWHWFWNWGNGELGNNGVHMLDVARWGMKVDFPTEVSSMGGRFRFKDDQETPDTNVVTFRFDGDKMIRWEGLSCNRMPAGSAPDVRFVGEKGSLDIVGGGYVQYDDAGKQVKKATGSNDDAVHIANFLGAVRSDTPLNSEIEEGYKSTLLCHLGNISYRTGQTLKCNTANGHILSSGKAQSLWGRSYAPGWEKELKG